MHPLHSATPKTSNLKEKGPFTCGHMLLIVHIEHQGSLFTNALHMRYTLEYFNAYRPWIFFSLSMFFMVCVEYRTNMLQRKVRFFIRPSNQDVDDNRYTTSNKSQ